MSHVISAPYSGPVPPPRVGLTATDWAARGVVLICGLNLNDVANMVLGLNQTFSLVLFVFTAFLAIRCGGRRMTLPLFVFLVTIGLYLAFGLIFLAGNPPPRALDLIRQYAVTYGGTLVVVFGTTSYLLSIMNRPGFRPFMNFTRNTFLVTAASVWLSPVLVGLYVNVPSDAKHRLSGFFANAGEAAYAAIMAVILIAVFRYRSRPVQIAALAIAAGAVILTFTKGAIVLLLLIAVVIALHRSKRIGLVLIPVLPALAFAWIEFAKWAINALLTSGGSYLTNWQRVRLASVADVLSGRIDDETTTGRTVVWDFAVANIGERFPLGSGLHTFHSMEGGVFQDAWLGAHNMFLMVVGEAGVIALAALMVLFVVLARAALKLTGNASLFVLTMTMAMFFIFNTSHTAFESRYLNLILAILLAVAAVPAMARRAPRAAPRPV